MPITLKHGSIFDSTADVLVCPVNCVGVMGKGLALEFKRRFARECEQYTDDCKRRWGPRPGQVIWYGKEPKIAMAATKGYWRDPSSIEWVESCLDSLRRNTGEPSIAIPQLGCGCGGLDWDDVWPLYERHIGGLDADVEVWIHESL